MIITQTPLRISFAGGGTDFEGFYAQEEGCVVSSAIDKYVYVIIKERFDDKIYLNYSRKEIVDRVDDIQHEIVRLCMKKTGLEGGVEITTLADVPSEGSGLGSSGSVTVGLLNAMYGFLGDFRESEKLAWAATEIEVDSLKRPIGKQDQYIAAYGHLRCFRFKRDGSVDVEKVPLSGEARRRLEEQLMLFFTDRTRDSSAVLSEQKRNIDSRRETLRAIRDLAYEARDCLLGQGNGDLGRILDQGWRLKKQLASQISDGQLDDLYQRALDAGAIGGKIAGAGGGGFLLLYCPVENQGRVRSALANFRELPFALERYGSRVIFNTNRHELK